MKFGLIDACVGENYRTEVKACLVVVVSMQVVPDEGRSAKNLPHFMDVLQCDVLRHNHGS